VRQDVLVHGEVELGLHHSVGPDDVRRVDAGLGAEAELDGIQVGRCDASTGNMVRWIFPCGSDGLPLYLAGTCALEVRAKVGVALCERCPLQAVFVGLTSVHWWEAWKYGQRAYCYCKHDLGHAIAAAALG